MFYFIPPPRALFAARRLTSFLPCISHALIPSSRGVVYLKQVCFDFPPLPGRGLHTATAVPREMQRSQRGHWRASCFPVSLKRSRAFFNLGRHTWQVSISGRVPKRNPPFRKFISSRPVICNRSNTSIGIRTTLSYGGRKDSVLPQMHSFQQVHPSKGRVACGAAKSISALQMQRGMHVHEQQQMNTAFLQCTFADPPSEMFGPCIIQPVNELGADRGTFGMGTGGWLALNTRCQGTSGARGIK